MALTEREKAILRLKTEGASDYWIARKLKMETPNVTRARKNALKKIDYARALTWSLLLSLNHGGRRHFRFRTMLDLIRWV